MTVESFLWRVVYVGWSVGIAYNLSGECEAQAQTVCGLVPVLANVLQQDIDSLVHEVAALMSAISVILQMFDKGLATFLDTHNV